MVATGLWHQLRYSVVNRLQLSCNEGYYNIMALTVSCHYTQVTQIECHAESHT